MIVWNEGLGQLESLLFDDEVDHLVSEACLDTRRAVLKDKVNKHQETRDLRWMEDVIRMRNSALDQAQRLLDMNNH